MSDPNTFPPGSVLAGKSADDSPDTSEGDVINAEVVEADVLEGEHRDDAALENPSRESENIEDADIVDADVVDAVTGDAVTEDADNGDADTAVADTEEAVTEEAVTEDADPEDAATEDADIVGEGGRTVDEIDEQRETVSGSDVEQPAEEPDLADLAAEGPDIEVSSSDPGPIEQTQPFGAVHAPAFDVQAARMQSLSMAKALNAGLRKALFDNPKVILMGEDIGPLGGVFRVTEGLQAEFGTRRVLDTPLAESGIIGTAIGLAMRGYRPVCEIQFDGFIFPGFDQITSQLAKITNRHEGTLRMPVVIRVPFGGHIGAIEHHQESPEAYFAHTPGLRVVSPSNPNDAYWMIQEAIASNDPVMFFEPKSRYWPKGEVDLLESAVPLHSSRVVRTGTDVTVLGYGAMVSQLLHVAELAAEEGTSVEVIDLRSISPIDYAPILESVRRTGHLVVAQEAPGFVSVGSEIAATVTEKAFYALEAPVIRVAAFDTPFPPSKVEELYLPDADRVLEAIDRSLAY